MKTKIFVGVGLFLLLSIGLYAGGLDAVTDKAKDLKETLFNLAKVVAAIGLIFLTIRYFLQSSEQRTIPWGWIIAAIILGASKEILELFGIA